MENTPLHFLEIFLFYSFIVFHCVILSCFMQRSSITDILIVSVFVTINITVVNRICIHIPALLLSSPRPSTGPVCLLTYRILRIDIRILRSELLSRVNSWWNFSQYWQIPFRRALWECHTAFIPELCETYCFHKSLAKILCCQTKRSAYLIGKKCYLSILLICISLLEKHSWFFSCG